MITPPNQCRRALPPALVPPCEVFTWSPYACGSLHTVRHGELPLTMFTTGRKPADRSLSCERASVGRCHVGWLANGRLDQRCTPHVHGSADPLHCGWVEHSVPNRRRFGACGGTPKHSVQELDLCTVPRFTSESAPATHRGQNDQASCTRVNPARTLARHRLSVVPARHRARSSKRC